jgi:hypothetical protein
MAGFGAYSSEKLLLEEFTLGGLAGCSAARERAGRNRSRRWRVGATTTLFRIDSRFR